MPWHNPIRAYYTHISSIVLRDSQPSCGKVLKLSNLCTFVFYSLSRPSCLCKLLCFKLETSTLQQLLCWLHWKKETREGSVFMGCCFSAKIKAESPPRNGNFFILFNPPHLFLFTSWACLWALFPQFGDRLDWSYWILQLVYLLWIKFGCLIDKGREKKGFCFTVCLFNVWFTSYNIERTCFEWILICDEWWLSCVVFEKF